MIIKIHKYLSIILLTIMFGTVIHSRAQLDPNKLTHFDELDGTIIYDVMPDRMGNIWIATQSGLLRFDGYEYTRFHPDPNDSTTMGSILTYALHEDQYGNIWIGCMDNIYKYDEDTHTFKGYSLAHLTDFPEYAMIGAVTISHDNEGRIYFGVVSFTSRVGSHALIYYDEIEDRLKTFEYADSLDLQNVYLSTLDPFGNIWLVAWNGVFKIDTAQQLFHIMPTNDFEIDQNDHLNAIKSDPNGLIWSTSNTSKLLAYDHKNNKLKTWPMVDSYGQAIDTDSQLDIAIDSTNGIWIGTQQGLIYFDRQKSSFEVFESKPESQHLQTEINCLSFDSFGNLWMGTDSEGLYKYNDRPLLKSFVYRVNDSHSITSGWVSKIFESEDGLIWMATGDGGENDGLNVLDPKSMTLTPYPYRTLGEGFNRVTVFGEINTNEILLETDRGLFVFNYLLNKITISTFNDVPDSVHIFNGIDDNRGNICYCTTNGLYLKNKKTNTIRHIDLSGLEGSNTFSNTLTNVWNSEKHGLWLLTNHGLFLYDYDTKVVERHGYDINKGDVFSSQDINSFHEDENGIVWVGTWQGGLCRYNPETGEVKTYSISDGLPHMSIQGILADEKNKTLWLSTFEGISRFSIEQEQFNNFSVRDGIQGHLFADGAYLKTSDGLLLFGGSNGITIINPEDISQNSKAPKVYITDFKIGTTSISRDMSLITQQLKNQKEIIILNHNQNNISFDYTGIQYDNPSRNSFTYKLENYDDSWREVGNLRSAFYYNIPPGKYTFRVKAANSNGVWNEEAAALSIKINPPWWKTRFAYVVYALILIAVIFVIDRVQRSRLVEKANKQAKEKELEQAREIEKAYNKLKTTQKQLLHAEKMASLGELTAGIAHEIQNPLNFVNNFSDVSVDLIEEMDEEMKDGNTEEVIAIAGDLKQNLEKITLHGKRASFIVRGMLEHSRTNTGDKKPTDINVLADEFLRLSYHGLRAKDKSFNAEFKTEFDENLPKINVIPQDFGRVLLNLINNAFYAVAEKQKQQPENYKPLVTIRTSKKENQIEIKVSDNGNGIPSHVKDKIFQPFFTTKPTGEGTGLGLSLSYDIINKGHQGDLKVKTIEGEGTEFIIIIPEK